MIGRSAKVPRTGGVPDSRRARQPQRRPNVSFGHTCCHTDAIRTTLDIDDDLITTLLARLPGRSKTEAIEHAIGAFLATDAVDRLMAFAGTLEIEDMSVELRKLDRTT